MNCTRYWDRFILVLGLVLFLVPIAQAESLWSDDAWFANPYSERQAKRVGDLVQVIISEKMEASNQTSAGGGKETNISLDPGLGVFDFVPPASLDRSSSRTGTRNNQRGLDAAATITCQVIEVLDTGNLKIEGAKEIYINQERETLHLVGIVAPQDVMEGNVIYSDRIAEAVIKFDGTLKPKEKKGLLGFFEGLFGSVLDVLF